MSNNKPIRRVAIIGTGVIGASWTALFLAKGLEVIATDIAPDAETLAETLREGGVARARAIGSRARRIAITSHVHSRRAGSRRTADFVQENGPERIDFKKKLYRQLDELLPADVIIASSSSGLTMSEIQSDCRLHPERCVIGHPFNPPHLVPLVEIVGGAKTSEADHSACRGVLHRIGEAGRSAAKGSTRTCGQPPTGGVGARGLLSRRRGRRQRRRRRQGAVLGTGTALGHHGQHYAQSPRRRPRRHRALLRAVHRPYDGLVEGARLARIDARSATASSSTALHAEVGSRSIAELEAQRDEILLGLLELRSKSNPRRPRRPGGSA